MCTAFLVYCRALLDESVPQNVLETDAPCTVLPQISRVFGVTRPNGIARQSRNSSNGKFRRTSTPTHSAARTPHATRPCDTVWAPCLGSSAPGARRFPAALPHSASVPVADGSPCICFVCSPDLHFPTAPLYLPSSHQPFHACSNSQSGRRGMWQRARAPDGALRRSGAKR